MDTDTDLDMDSNRDTGHSIHEKNEDNMARIREKNINMYIFFYY